MPAPKIARYLALILAVAALVLFLKGQEHDDVTALRGQVSTLNTELRDTQIADSRQWGQIGAEADDAMRLAAGDTIPLAPLTGHCPLTRPRQCVLTRGNGVGELDVASPYQGGGTPWMVTDHSGAPMAWVNLAGMYSGGDGGKEPGGLICVTYSVTSYSACITPTGTLQLTPTGPHGPTGPTETLTAGSVAFIVCLEKAGATLDGCRAREAGQ